MVASCQADIFRILGLLKHAQSMKSNAGAVNGKGNLAEKPPELETPKSSRIGLTATGRKPTHVWCLNYQAS